VRGERLDPELPGERIHAVLGGTNPLPPDLDHLPVAEVVVEDPAADPVPGLQDHHRPTGSHEVPGRHQAREPGTHDANVGLSCLRHGTATIVPLRRRGMQTFR
jgi:hypothetical protein